MADVLTRFGRYILLDQIAQGGMAEIFRAYLAGKGSAGRILTIKRIQPQYGTNPEFVSMFKSEINVTMGFSHPNIVQLYDFGEEQAQPFIAMEFVDGRNLRQFMNRFGDFKQKFPIELAVYVTEQAAAGLHYAHTFRDKITGEPMSIVHRDISPQNILISYEGGVKIIDFGIAKAASNTDSTRAGVIKGKPSYLSPEQISGEKLDARCDIFALGIVFWELLVGRKLFSGENDLAVLKQIESCATHVKPPSQFNPKVDAELDQIVLKALQKNRDKRYASAEEFRRHLHRYLFNRFQDFNPGDLSYTAKDLFKNDIVEDRKKIQRLNERAEEVIAAENQKIEVESFDRDKSALDRQSTVIDANLRFTASGSRDRFEGSDLKNNEFQVEVGSADKSSPGRRSGGYIARHHGIAPVPSSQESLKTRTIAKSKAAATRAFRVLPGLVATAALAAGVLFGVPFVLEKYEAFKRERFGGREPTSVGQRDSASGANRSFEDLIGSVKPAQNKATRTIALQINVQPRTGAPGEILVNSKPVDWANPVISVQLDQPIEVIVRRLGYRSVQREFVVSSREVEGMTAIPIDIQLSSVKFGFFSLRATPSAEVNFVVDGQKITRMTPLINERLPVGTYTMTLRNALLGMEKQITVRITENRKVSLEERLEIQD